MGSGRIEKFFEYGNNILSAIDGNKFYYADYVALNNSSHVIHIKTGSNKCEMVASISAGLATTISLKEDAVCSADGTAVILRNHNRNKPDDALKTKVFYTPTTSGGVEIKKNQAGFGTNPGQAQSGNGGEIIPYYLKPNTSYVYTLTMAGNSVVQFSIGFREM